MAALVADPAALPCRYTAPPISKLIRRCLPWCHFRLWLDTNRRRCAPAVKSPSRDRARRRLHSSSPLCSGISLDLDAFPGVALEFFGSIAQRVIGRRGHKPGNRADPILILTGWVGTAGTGGQQLHHKKHSNMISTFPA